MATYKFNFPNMRKVDEKFQKIFGTKFRPFYEQLSPILFGYVTIDIVAFDEWLHKEIGNYEDQGLSMTQAIIQHYGDQANTLIDNLLP